ncbi:hypothetical protein [Staphylococcus aureus]|nr:hypothetical protein [Staphylococcus aureus]
MPKKTVTIDVDENLLVVASNEISKQSIQIIDKLTWGV